MKLKFGFYAMIMALCAVTFSACDSDEPGGNTDPETPETPVEPAEPLTDEIRPVLTDGKKWTCMYMWANTKKNEYDIINCHFYGETTVNGVNAKLIKCVNSHDKESFYIQREENGMVLEKWLNENGHSQPTESNFLYAYEVNPQEGKQFTDHMSGFKIISKGTIVLMGKTRRAVLVKETRDDIGKHYVYDLWVEGIGPLFGSKGFYEPGVPTTPRYYWRPMYVKMLECYDGDEKIYDHSEFSPERYKPEVVFHEPDADAYEILAKMADGSFVTEWNERNTPTEPDGPAEPLTDEIRPVLTEGKKWIKQDIWHSESDRIWASIHDTHTEYFDKEIEMNGVLEKIVKCVECSNYEQFFVEENGVVYKRWEFFNHDTFENEIKHLYSYEVNPQENKTLTDALHQTISFMSKGTVVLWGKTRRAAMVKIHSYYYTLYDYWIEGIGPIFGVVPYDNNVLPTTALFNWKPIYVRLLECYDGDEKIYDFRTFSPDRYTPEVVFEELDENALEIVNKMIDGTIIDIPYYH